TNKVEEVLLQLPKHFFHEVCGIAEYENMEMNDFIYQATKNYVEHKKAEFILYERMQKGYQEMEPINLKICSEAFLAEAEANHTGNRSVIGAWRRDQKKLRGACRRACAAGWVSTSRD